MDKYEISLWEDYQKSEIVNGETITYLDERKLCVVGADTMTSQARALEPKLTENINGTHTFTFKMFMKYVDNETGEAYDNPFLHLLINERKVKVFWKDTWYDLVIKRCQEDSSGKSIVYTCTDLFINELSKNGFELNFATDLENNIGTVEDLATATLKGTTWTYDSDSDQIYQKNEEPVYETTTEAKLISAILQTGGEEDTPSQTISKNSKILVFYSSASKILDKYKQLQEKYPYEQSESNSNITIISQPVNFVGRVGINAYFNVEASGSNLTYQWQVNSDGTWKNSGTTGNKTKTARAPIIETRYSYFYRCVIKDDQGNTIITRPVRMINDSYEIQFLYANPYEVDVNNLLVTNGNCYLMEDIMCELDDNTNVLTIKKTNSLLFTIPMGEGVSENYRAERLVKSPLTEFDEVVDRYVTVCKENNTNKKVYLIENTEYTDPLAVVNLIANPTQYKNTNGWLPIGNEDITWKIWPEFEEDTVLNRYTAKSYLKLYGTIQNTGLTSNISYLTPTESEARNGDIGGFQIGEKYIFRFKAVTNNNSHPTDTYVTSNIVTCVIKDSNNNSYFNSVYNGVKDDHWVEYTLTCTTSCSAEKIKDLGLYLTLDGIYWFEDIQFFKYTEGITSYTQGAQPQRMNPGEINLQSIAVKTYKYFYADHPDIEDVKQLTYIYAGKQESEDYPIQYNKYEKLATINVKESNRFNILQTIAETFKCWVRFRIEHEANGKIKFIDGIPQKFVTFKAEVGDDEKKLCFEYGIDLKAISRTIDSNSIVTKVIVLENSNEFAQNGFCTITRSNENYSKSNFILNFDYYTQQGLLSKDQLSKDLYGTSTNDIGYYYHLRWYNRDYDGLSNELIIKKMDQIKQNSQLTTYRQYYISASEKLNNIKSDICKLASAGTWEDAQTYVQSHTKNTKVQSLMNSYAEVNNQIIYYNQLIVQAQAALLTLNNYISNLNIQIESILDNIETLNNKFNAKYGSYIQEGTWQDESYIDDDKYYFDATNVSYTSSRPQITYSISVLRLSGLEEFSSKVFKVGDICYMIDREYFGYSDLETKTPYKEKILVNEITSNFDTPEKDTIQVRNYKTRFDDLFQRIAAATQSLQYSEGEYNRAAGAVNTNRTLSFSLLQDTFDANSNLILNASNQDVTWDGTGITVTNKLNSADKTKIIAGGIFVTNDGGETWKNAVRGDGISTELLTAGRIDTTQIYVYDGNHPAFRWDSDGLTAYYHDSNGTNFGKFVRHDKYGLYGYDNRIAYPSEALASRPSEWDKDFIPNSENDIWTNSNTKFALTWQGFMLRKTNSNNSAGIEINSENNEEKIIRVYSGQDETFYLKTDGTAYFEGDITATGGNIGGFKIENSWLHGGSGSNFVALNGSKSSEGTTTGYAIWAGARDPDDAPFYVTSSGHIKAHDIDLGGTQITNVYIQSPEIYGGELYAGNTANIGAAMTTNGLQVYSTTSPGSSNKETKIRLECVQSGNTRYPYLMLGAGTASDYSDAALVMKFGRGLWLGSANVKDSPGLAPLTSSLDVNSEGIFINFSENKIEKYWNGTKSEFGATAKFA